MTHISTEQPPAAHQEPVGYMRWKNGSAEYVTRKHLEHPDDEDWHAVYTAPQPTENLHCKSNQKRLATLWGYVKARQPLTDVEVYDVIVSLCSDGSAPSFQEAKEDAPRAFEFARAIEATHNIT